MTNATDSRTVDSVRKRLRAHLAATYGEGEAEAMVRLIFSALKGWNVTDLLIHADTELSDFTISEIRSILDRLDRHEPIQYILGKARFYGMDFTVSPDVLIPRPETEELVDRIVADYSGEKDLKVLDIGTGSGCIAIALARNLPFSEVTAIDISEKAIAIARKNAADLHAASVRFVKEDILTATPRPDEEGHYDIIVSNPPYICRREMADMDRNVLDHEPHSALFVPDDDPLLFYKAIAAYSREALRPGGRLYMEINPLYASEMEDMLKDVGMQDVSIADDISRKHRFVIASR